MGTQAGLRRSGPGSCPPGSQHGAGPPGGLGAVPGHRRPGEKDWCADKDWLRQLWASESVSATPNILSAQGVHTVPHHPVLDSPPASRLPSWPLWPLWGCRPLGQSRRLCRPETTATPCAHLPSHRGPTLVHLWVPHSTLKVSPSGWVPNPWGPEHKGSWETCPSEQMRWSPGRLCCCSCVPAWGCSSVPPAFSSRHNPTA